MEDFIYSAKHKLINKATIKDTLDQKWDTFRVIDWSALGAKGVVPSIHNGPGTAKVLSKNLNKDWKTTSLLNSAYGPKAFDPIGSPDMPVVIYVRRPEGATDVSIVCETNMRQPSKNTKGRWHDAVRAIKSVKLGEQQVPLVERFSDYNDRHIYMRLSDDTWTRLEKGDKTKNGLETLPTKLEFLVISKQVSQSTS
eukprot:GHVU01040936.1.p1 GENE.GHVU01040936.1~~GHVU01040936.1.p1  ORF type:complete len:196 (+),score=16.65 GHVU01040936.1:180-767(+)